MISDESFVAIAEAAVHQGPESLQRDCAMFASRSTKAEEMNEYTFGTQGLGFRV